ncbi:MAG: hypothetical protein V1916_03090 [Patescibacteria group bacterium]
MFENVQTPAQPAAQPPKDWGPWKPVSQPRPSGTAGPIPPPPLDPNVPLGPVPSTPVDVPRDLNVPGSPVPPEPSKKRFIMIGVLIFALLVVLIGGAIFAMNYLSKNKENANNTNTTANGNTNVTANSNNTNNANVTVNGNANTTANLNNANATTAAQDCKADLKCLIQASVDCKPAKVSYTTTTNLGVQQTTTSYYELRKSDPNKCTLYLRTDKIDLVFPSSISPEIVNQQKALYKTLEGVDGTCKYTTTDLTAMLTRWDQGTIESGTVTCPLSVNGGSTCTIKGGDFGVAECQGTYFETQATPSSNSNKNINTNANVNSIVNTNAISNANTNSPTNSATVDIDRDGIPDKYESYIGTDSLNQDTDGDTYSDGAELAKGYSPLAANTKVTISLYDTYCLAFAAGEMPTWTTTARTTYCQQLRSSGQTMLTMLLASPTADVSTVDVTALVTWCNQTFTAALNTAAQNTACTSSLAPNLGIFFQSKKIYDPTTK